MAEDQQQPARKSDRYSGQGGSGQRRSGGFKSGGPKRDGGNRGGGFRGGDDRRRDDRRRDDRGPRGDGERKPFRSDRSGDGQGRRGGFDKRDGGFKPRRDGDRDDRRPRRDGDFKPRREGEYKPRRDGDRDDRRPRRDGDFKGRRDGDFKKRDGDRFDRGPRRSFRDDDRGGKKRPMRHRSGGQFRRRDDVETPIQTSLTGSPMPIRVDTKPVVDVPRPWFPDKEEWPEVPRRLLMEIESTARESEIKEVAVAVMIGTAAFEQGDLDRALEFFSWAKTRAARSITIREGLGICYYVAGEFEQAQRELQAFTRISGRAEHNHILADCSRATGNGDRVPELINQMVEAWKKEPEFFDLMNLIEGLIVLAGYWLEDRNEPEQALAAINMVALPEDADITESHLRLWHVQARAAEAAGDTALAKAALDEIKAVNPEWLMAMDKWIAGEDIDEFLQPWATEIPVPEPEPTEDEEPQDTDHPMEDEDGDILPDEIPDHLQAKADEADDEDEEDEEDDSWDPGDDWEDEDWDEEDPEPGIPVEDLAAEEAEASPDAAAEAETADAAVVEIAAEAEDQTEADDPPAEVAEQPADAEPTDAETAEAAVADVETVGVEAAEVEAAEVEAVDTDVAEAEVASEQDAQPSLFDDES